MLTFLLTFILGFILGAAAVVLRRLRLEAAILAATRAELDAERKRRHALAGALRQALAENNIAAAQIAALAAALEAAAVEVQTERGGVRLAQDARERFCWN